MYAEFDFDVRWFSISPRAYFYQNYLAKDKKLASKLGVYEIESIYCYYRGHKIEFKGQRSTDILVEFILELDEHPVEDINSKVEVTAFSNSFNRCLRRFSF